MTSLFDRGSQFSFVGIDDEHGEQPCRFGIARIPADGMAGAGCLVETFAGAVDPPGFVIHLGLDFAREDVAEDEADLA